MLNIIFIQQQKASLRLSKNNINKMHPKIVVKESETIRILQPLRRFGRRHEKEAWTYRKAKIFPQSRTWLKAFDGYIQQTCQCKHLLSNIVNTLLLGGIVNILCQIELFDDAFERVKVLGTENVQTKFRLESHENWLLKLNEKTQEATEKIKDCG